MRFWEALLWLKGAHNIFAEKKVPRFRLRLRQRSTVTKPLWWLILASEIVATSNISKKCIGNVSIPTPPPPPKEAAKQKQQ